MDSYHFSPVFKAFKERGATRNLVKVIIGLYSSDWAIDFNLKGQEFDRNLKILAKNDSSLKYIFFKSHLAKNIRPNFVS
ncbi:MAG: hypothetical protein H5U05_10575 [Candidatus Aminicenantes bacterium]|nr:hypothetical protein [Candidatus Aminicenantes bacterium]